MAKKKGWARAGELEKFRDEFGLNKTQVVDLLKRCGMHSLNWATYHRWATGKVTPKPVYEEALFNAVEDARTKLKAAKGDLNKVLRG